MSSLRDTQLYGRLTELQDGRDFQLDIALGRVPGMDLALITGVNPNISVADGEVSLMDLTQHKMIFPTAPVDVFISSTNAGDTVPRVLIIGLLADFTQVLIITQLNGQTPVNIGTQLRHVQRARILDATPAGNVYISRTSNMTAGVPNVKNDVLSYIAQGKNTSRHGFFMVPKGVSAISTALRGNTDAESKPAEIYTNIRLNGDINLQTVSYSVSPGFAQFLFPTPLGSSNTFGTVTRILPEGTLVEFTAKASANNTRVFFGIDLILVNNGLFADNPVL